MKADGKALLVGGTNAVPADVVALLAGVSFGSVIKVITAINTLHGVSGIALSDILRRDALPGELAGDARRRNTATAVDWILAHPLPASAQRTLRLNHRFGARAVGGGSEFMAGNCYGGKGSFPARECG